MPTSQLKLPCHPFQRRKIKDEKTTLGSIVSSSISLPAFSISKWILPRLEYAIYGIYPVHLQVRQVLGSRSLNPKLIPSIFAVVDDEAEALSQVDSDVEKKSPVTCAGKFGHSFFSRLQKPKATPLVQHENLESTSTTDEPYQTSSPMPPETHSEVFMKTYVAYVEHYVALM
jgi:hypothetical protein